MSRSPTLQSELAALAALQDEAIDTSDLPESDDWDNVERGRFYRPVTIRDDASSPSAKDPRVVAEIPANPCSRA
jgi:hypothetical protein